MAMERFEDIARSWDATEVPADAIPASTAILLRDHADGMQVLMLRRNTKLAFVGGAWVFPGGRVDPGDIPQSSSTGRSVDAKANTDGEPEAEAGLDPELSSMGAAVAAARRETMEEAGLDISDTALEPLSHWMPPAGTPRRFSTWFFVTQAPAGAIIIDGGEIHDHMWTTAAIALEKRDAGDVQLAPPTFVTLVSLSRFSSVAEALPVLSSEPVEYFETRILDDDGVMTALWHGDEDYPDSASRVDGDGDGDGPSEGSRHRLRMSPESWIYERTLESTSKDR